MELFNLIVAAFSNSENEYDSLVEVCLGYSDEKQTNNNYEKSLELNPQTRMPGMCWKNLKWKISINLQSSYKILEYIVIKFFI